MLDAAFSFHSPVKAHYGAGSRKLIPDLVKGYQRIGIVSGRTTLEKTGMGAFLEQSLPGKSLYFFRGVEPNPSIECIVEGARLISAHSCQAIIAVGGGSGLDAGKAIAALATNQQNFHQLIELAVFPEQPLPMIAVPTTCGTGSEMNHYAIITDRAQKDKLNFSAENTFPSHAVLDPELLSSLSPELVLATAFDALTHGLEGFISTRANPFTDMIAIDAMGRILAALTSGIAPTETKARTEFLYGSALAGVVILHTGTTILHALGYYLTTQKGIHHGAANALLLPHFLQLLGTHNVAKHEKIIEIFAHHKFHIAKYLEKLGAPGTLKDILEKEEITTMVDYALAKKNAKTTPIPLSREEIINILLK